MKEDTLSDMVSHLTEKVGLVHQMPFAYDRGGVPATLEKVMKEPFALCHKENLNVWYQNNKTPN